MSMVAALYVDPRGIYAGLPDVEVWDEARDARLYDGPWPVVAHPPCKLWSLMGQCRGYSGLDVDDGGCFAAALDAVRRYGGVLEHPAHTRAWRAFCLPRPPHEGWTRSITDEGWVCEVDQFRYGHRANKRTWLYYVGDQPPPMLAWGRAARSAITVRNDGGGGRDQRSKTPVAFRDVLIGMARATTATVWSAA